MLTKNAAGSPDNLMRKKVRVITPTMTMTAWIERRMTYRVNGRTFPFQAGNAARQ